MPIKNPLKNRAVKRIEIGDVLSRSWFGMVRPAKASDIKLLGVAKKRADRLTKVDLKEVLEISPTGYKLLEYDSENFWGTPVKRNLKIPTYADKDNQTTTNKVGIGGWPVI